MPEGVGYGSEAVDSSIEQQGAQNVESTNAAQEAPLAQGPLQPMKVSRMAGSLQAVIGTLTDGEMQMQMPEVAEPLTQLPAEIFGPMVAVEQVIGFLGQKGVQEAAQYAHTAAELASSNEGIDEAYNIYEQLGRDQALLSALQAGEPEAEEQPPAAQPPQAAPPEDMGALV